MFTVEQLVSDHFPAIPKHSLRYKSSVALLRRLLHEQEFVRFAEEYPHLSGFEFVEQVLDYFDFSYKVDERQRQRIPASGRVVIIANHPIGSLDGLALLALVGSIRRDVKAVVNQMLTTIPPLNPLLLPVNNMGGGNKKSVLKPIHDHLDGDGAVIIFPAGEVSRLKPNGVKDSAWRGGFLRMATQAKAPIVPIHVKGRNSAIFYGASLLWKPLATLLLVKEMFKQRDGHIELKIGEPIPFESYRGDQLSHQAKVKLFRKHLYQIGRNRRGCFKTETAIAHPESRTLLSQQIKSCQLLGETPDGKQIRLFQGNTDAPLLREIGRLREVAFRAVGEGSGRKRDLDRYDSYYQHLILWDPDDLEIAGAYRLGETRSILETQGRKGLYTDSLFNYNDSFQPYLNQGLELGRSFVQPRYWGKRSLDYLWHGIGAYLRHYHDVRYLFGPVSISKDMPQRARELMIFFYQLYFGDERQFALSKRPYRLDDATRAELSGYFTGDNYKADFSQLKSLLANMGCSVPTLYKQYSEVCEPGGVQFLDFGVDPDFGDCVDGLVLVDITRLTAKKHARYIGTNA